MCDKESLAEARRRYGKHAFAVTTGPWKGVGTRTPGNVAGLQAHRIRAGWGLTWEEAFDAFDRRHAQYRGGSNE